MVDRTSNSKFDLTLSQGAGRGKKNLVTEAFRSTEALATPTLDLEDMRNEERVPPAGQDAAKRSDSQIPNGWIAQPLLCDRPNQEPASAFKAIGHY